MYFCDRKFEMAMLSIYIVPTMHLTYYIETMKISTDNDQEHLASSRFLPRQLLRKAVGIIFDNHKNQKKQKIRPFFLTLQIIK